MEKEKLFEVKDLRISANDDDGNEVKIVKGVTFDIHKGEVVALIGESGSGKTTISLATLAYTKPGLEFSGGEVLLDGQDLLQMSDVQHRDIRGRRVAYLAQSAAATFNPAITIGEQVTESAVLHGVLSQEDADKRAERLYSALELPAEELRLDRTLQRLVIAGTPDRVADEILAFRERVGAFGTLLYTGHDWADPELARTSMQLMSSEVWPRVLDGLR